MQVCRRKGTAKKASTFHHRRLRSRRQQIPPVRSISFARTGKTFECAETTTILSAVKAAGLPLPSSCARGMCGTCKIFKHSGEVTMAHEGGIRQREIDRGFILPCVSRPLTDIVLDC
ncbi:MAG: 2Fe-2S iron-sulfur cluster binding domain-containing protein [Sulfitobacter sp. SK025]|nr:MAG: 2Fe-2S iron-sulfur cluster binding domain-containing protein [Sulfitobacter sp. SK025]